MAETHASESAKKTAAAIVARLMLGGGRCDGSASPACGAASLHSLGDSGARTACFTAGSDRANRPRTAPGCCIAKGGGSASAAPARAASTVASRVARPRAPSHP